MKVKELIEKLNNLSYEDKERRIKICAALATKEHYKSLHLFPNELVICEFDGNINLDFTEVHFIDK